MEKGKIDHLMVFTGSGVSYSSGLPDVRTLTSSILYDVWHEHTDKTFNKGLHPSEYLRKQDITNRVQKFLRILKESTDDYFIDRRDTEADYEDLYYICQQIEDNENLEIDNPAIEPFIEKIKFKLVGFDVFSPIQGKDILIDIQYLSERAIMLIQSVIWSELSLENGITGFDLINELYDNVQKLNLVTLNHDLLIEKKLEEMGLSYSDYNDGFGIPEGEIRYFDSNTYEVSSKVNLFKLHGSTNWYVFRIEENGIIVDKYGMAIGRDHHHLKDSSGKMINNLSFTPIFLTGSYNKLVDYGFGIIKSIHTHFERVLENTNLIIMSGYGWNDRGINGRIFEWLRLRTDNRIILLHENPEHLKHNSKSALWHRYDTLVETGQLILVRKWFSDTTYADLEVYLNGC